MKIRRIIENDIVEDISIYKDIFKIFIELIRDVKPDYEPSFTFNKFCIKFINNFQGVDEDLTSYNENMSLTENLLNAIIKIAFEELKDDEKNYKKLEENIKDV
jgi:lipoate-protein ligase A